MNGEPIALEEVRTLCEQEGLEPERALKLLIEERLLAQYAEERGYAELPSSRMELQRARVRALLEQAVEAHTEDLQQRRSRLDELTKELRSRTRVTFEEKEVAEALGNEGPFGSGS